ncbi:hypothetical protein BESB_014000 [Besnoitia besnoiti]|uniref:RAP domain-containing protein n=1 Tax=Besnoitia besnoiti TaxID=94643 RepID=A0A2A9M2S6_BESBE|nr:hypothetical protein BESB_014000 [Besnoitia besnoiti]PFH32788.1 hypothetical protein BESB_014000 [Besnoitia besnoiti]
MGAFRGLRGGLAFEEGRKAVEVTRRPRVPSRSRLLFSLSRPTPVSLSSPPLAPPLLAPALRTPVCQLSPYAAPPRWSSSPSASSSAMSSCSPLRPPRARSLSLAASDLLSASSSPPPSSEPAAPVRLCTKTSTHSSVARRRLPLVSRRFRSRASPQSVSYVFPIDYPFSSSSFVVPPSISPFSSVVAAYYCFPSYSPQRSVRFFHHSSEDRSAAPGIRKLSALSICTSTTPLQSGQRAFRCVYTSAGGGGKEGDPGCASQQHGHRQPPNPPERESRRFSTPSFPSSLSPTSSSCSAVEADRPANCAQADRPGEETRLSSSYPPQHLRRSAPHLPFSWTPPTPSSLGEKTATSRQSSGGREAEREPVPPNFGAGADRRMPRQQEVNRNCPSRPQEGVRASPASLPVASLCRYGLRLPDVSPTSPSSSPGSYVSSAVRSARPEFHASFPLSSLAAAPSEPPASPWAGGGAYSAAGSRDVESRGVSAGTGNRRTAGAPALSTSPWGEPEAEDSRGETNHTLAAFAPPSGLRQPNSDRLATEVPRAPERDPRAHDRRPRLERRRRDAERRQERHWQQEGLEAARPRLRDVKERREKVKTVVGRLLEEAVELVEAFEVCKEGESGDLSERMRKMEKCQSDIFDIHKKIAAHVHAATEEELLELRGHVEALLMRQKLVVHRHLLLPLLEELYRRDMVGGVRTSTLVRYFRDLCDTGHGEGAVPDVLIKRVHASIMDRKREFLESHDLGNALLLFLYNCCLLRLPTGGLYSEWAQRTLQPMSGKPGEAREPVKISPPLVVFISRVLIAERCGVVGVWHAVLDLTLSIDPRTSPFFFAASASVELKPARQPAGSSAWVLEAEGAEGDAAPADGEADDRLSRYCPGDEAQWLANATRTAAGAASMGIRFHPALQIIFDRVVEAAKKVASDAAFRTLFVCQAERHSCRLLQYIWSLCFYNLHLHEDFPQVLHAACRHGRLDYAAQYLLNFSSPAFVPFQVAEAIMFGQRENGALVRSCLSATSTEILEDILTCVRPSCPAWASNFLSPHPHFRGEFERFLSLNEIRFSFLNRRGVSCLHLVDLKGDGAAPSPPPPSSAAPKTSATASSASRVCVVLIDLARQPRDLTPAIQPGLLGGHMMQNRLLRRLGWRVEVVCQSEWDALDVEGKHTLVKQIRVRSTKKSNAC